MPSYAAVDLPSPQQGPGGVSFYERIMREVIAEMQTCSRAGLLRMDV
jgi:hypothetical protein